MAVLLLAYGSLQRHGLLRYLEYLAHLLHGHIHCLCQLVRLRIAAELLKKLTRNSNQLVYRFDHVDGDADSSRLIRYGARYRLAYPPCSVCRELIPSAIVELFYSFYKTEVALLYQIEKQHASAYISFRNADHQTQIRLRKLALRGLVAFRHAHSQLSLLLRSEQRHLAYLLEIHAHRIVNADGIQPCFEILRLRRFCEFIERGRIVQHVHPGVVQSFIEPLELFRLQMYVVQNISYFFICEHALLLARFYDFQNVFFFMGFFPLRIFYCFCILQLVFQNSTSLSFLVGLSIYIYNKYFAARRHFSFGQRLSLSILCRFMSLILSSMGFNSSISRAHSSLFSSLSIFCNILRF